MAAHDHRMMSSPHLGPDPLFATSSSTGESHYPQQDSPFALSSDYTGQEPWKMDSFPQQGYLGAPTTTEFLPGVDQSSNLLNMDCLSELDLLPDTPTLSVPDVKPLLLDSSSSSASCAMPPIMGMPSAQHSYHAYDPSLGSEVAQISFIEQQQAKLRQTQQLQQQKLLELQQTILQAQLLKTKLSLASIAVPSNDVATTSVAQSQAGTVSSPSNGGRLTTTTTSMGGLPMPPGLKLPLPQQPGGRSTELIPERKTAHNAIERKYRLSINDRINDLRQIITQGDEEMGKKLQKAAVLRKTIDYIRHLENNNRKLLAENRKLRQKVDSSSHSAQLEQGPVAMVTDTQSEPETPPSTSSGASSPASRDEPTSPLHEGHAILPPESPLPSKPPGAHDDNTFSGLLSFLHMGDMSRVALCVVMMFTVALLPGNIFSSAPSALDYSTLHGSARHLFTLEDPTVLSVSSLLLTVCVRLFIAWLCVGWLVAQSLPLLVATSSRGYSSFGKFIQQARSCKRKGEYHMAITNYHKALDAVHVAVSTSFVSKMAAVVWQVVTFVYLRCLCGAWFVRVARRRTIRQCKDSVGPLEVAQAMFECQEAAMLHCSSFSLGRWQLALSAVNTAQVFGRVPGEYWLLCALECRLSLPAPFSSPAMRCCLWMAKAHLSFLPPIYHWMVQSDGREFLSSSEDSWKGGKHTTGKTPGPLGSPLLSATHAYLEQLLSEAYREMLFPRPSASQDPSFVASVKSFRSILELSKSVFVSGEGLSSESGFEDITWWAAVGTIASTWLSDASDDAMDVYRLVESVPAVLAHNSDPLPTALLFAFRAHSLYHKKDWDASQVLQLLHNASSSLTSSVALPTEECSGDKTRSSLWECGRLLGCDWLLSLRLAMWEQAACNGAVRLTLARGYQTDVDSLSNLATTRTSILPRLLLHKSCLSIMNGANPMQTQQLLTFIKSARSVRKRKGQVATADSEDSISYEQAMAIVLTYKHLPGAFRLQEGGCLLQEAAAIFKKLGSHSGLRQCHALAAQ